MIMSRKALLAAALGLATVLCAKAESNVPQFREVYELLRTNLTGVSEAELNRAAVHGLVEKLSPKVTLADDKETSESQTNAPASWRSSVFESAFGYLRFGQFGSGAEKKMMTAYRQMASTNRLKGLIVDLRYSDGHDYAAAVALADRFFSKDEPLMDWGDGMKRASAKTNALALPITLLVNRKTAGAAEAFAAILRQAQVGLIIGTNTAGNAAIAKEFALSTGQHIRVATTPVKLGDGKAFPSSGLKPDIYVEVNPEDELAWFEDSYKVFAKPTAQVIPANQTNELTTAALTRRPRPRLNEAELVRMLREGLNPDNEVGSAARELEKARGIVGDPVLARALDLLKGLTVVQQFRSS
jgi:hypothetical protein